MKKSILALATVIASLNNGAKYSFSNPYGKAARAVAEGVKVVSTVKGFMTVTINGNNGEQTNLYCVTNNNQRFRFTEDQLESLAEGTQVTLIKRVATIDGRETHYFELETVGALSANTIGSAAEAVTA